MPNVDLLLDAVEGLPHTRRAMFGGHGFFAPNGAMFAAVVDGDRIALKLPSEEDRARFLEEGGEPWVYDGRTTMGGWFVLPDAMYDEPRALAEWARRAHATAQPPKRKPSTKKATKAAAKKSSTKGSAGTAKAARRRDGT